MCHLRLPRSFQEKKTEKYEQAVFVQESFSNNKGVSKRLKLDREIFGSSKYIVGVQLGSILRFFAFKVV